MKEIELLLKLAEKCTPGPWHSHNARIHAEDGETHVADFWQGDAGKNQAYANAEFCKEARNAIPELRQLLQQEAGAWLVKKDAPSIHNRVEFCSTSGSEVALWRDKEGVSIIPLYASPAAVVDVEITAMLAATDIMQRMFTPGDFDKRSEAFKRAYERERQDVIAILREHLHTSVPAGTK